MELSQLELLNILHYDLNTGLFTWKISQGRSKKGKKAGSKNSKGYIKITINNKEYLAHRLIWLYVYGYFPNQIDHINHIKDDNRIINLRNVTHKENHLNKPTFKNNSSGISGVDYNKRSKKWRARIQKDGKRILLGYFDTKEEAITIRLEAQSKLGFHINCNN